MNSLPRKGSLHSILSPREIVTGNKFRCPTICIGQYIQGLVECTNDTEQQKSIDVLYLGLAKSGSGHIVFKLDIKEVISVNKVVIILTLKTAIDCINKMRVTEKSKK